MNVFMSEWKWIHACRRLPTVAWAILCYRKLDTIPKTKPPPANDDGDNTSKTVRHRLHIRRLARCKSAFSATGSLQSWACWETLFSTFFDIPGVIFHKWSIGNVSVQINVRSTVAELVLNATFEQKRLRQIGYRIAASMHRRIIKIVTLDFSRQVDRPDGHRW